MKICLHANKVTASQTRVYIQSSDKKSRALTDKISVPVMVREHSPNSETTHDS